MSYHTQLQLLVFVTRHLTRGDVIFGQKFGTVIVKWSKTM